MSLRISNRLVELMTVLLFYAISNYSLAAEVYYQYNENGSLIYTSTDEAQRLLVDFESPTFPPVYWKQNRLFDLV